MLSDHFSEDEPSDLIVSCDPHVTLAVRLLNRRVEAKLLVLRQMIAEHDTEELEFIRVDIRGARSRAARSIEMPQTHHVTTESEPQHKPPVLRSNVRGEIEPCWLLPVSTGWLFNPPVTSV